MPISLKSAAGLGGFLRQERLILESGQFVAPFDGAYLVTAIGGGEAGQSGPLPLMARLLQGRPPVVWRKSSCGLRRGMY